MVKLLTDAAVRKYAPARQRRFIRDGGARSLFLIVEPSGHKSWQMRFRRPDGRPAKITLGPYDMSGRELEGTPQVGQPLTLAAARSLAADVQRRRALGEDVIADHKARKRRARAEIKERMETTFAACARQFVVEHKVKKARTRPRHWRETARLLGLAYPLGTDPAQIEPEIIKGGLAERWAEKDVREIDQHEIWEILDEAYRRAVPGIAPRQSGGLSDVRKRKLHALLSALFSWLREQRRIEVNPCSGLGHPPAPSARDRVLNSDEIKILWRACDAIDAPPNGKPPFGLIFKLLLLTGQRLREVAEMRREEIDNSGMWSLPGSRTKNGRPHKVPLPPMAQQIISSLGGDRPIIFSNGATAPSGWSRAKRRLDAAMLRIAEEEEGKDRKIAPWRLHDLRRTAVTHMAELGISPHVIELVVNHTSGTRGGIAGTYNRSELMEERRTALERSALHVAGLVEPRDNIVDWRAKRSKT